MQDEHPPTHASRSAAETAAGPGPREEGFHLPGPSIHPLVCAAGVALLGFGLLTSLLFSLVGILTLVWGLAGWIGELVDE